MSREVILIREALADVNSAYQWYEEQDRGLGEEFLRCLDAACGRISEFPDSIQSVSTPSDAYSSGGFRMLSISNMMKEMSGYITFSTVRRIPTDCVAD